MDLAINSLKAIVAKPVGNGKVGGLQDEIVPAYLCKCGLAN